MPAEFMNKKPPEFSGGLVVFCLLYQQFSDLDGVGGSALADLVTAAPQADAALVGQVGTDPANEDDILVGGVQRHGVHLLGQVIHQLTAGSIGDHFPGLFHSDRSVEVQADGDGVAADNGNTDAGEIGRASCRERV